MCKSSIHIKAVEKWKECRRRIIVIAIISRRHSGFVTKISLSSILIAMRCYLCHYCLLLLLCTYAIRCCCDNKCRWKITPNVAAHISALPVLICFQIGGLAGCDLAARLHRGEAWREGNSCCALKVCDEFPHIVRLISSPCASFLQGCWWLLLWHIHICNCFFLYVCARVWLIYAEC